MTVKDMYFCCPGQAIKSKHGLRHKNRNVLHAPGRRNEYFERHKTIVQ